MSKSFVASFMFLLSCFLMNAEAQKTAAKKNLVKNLKGTQILFNKRVYAKPDGVKIKSLRPDLFQCKLFSEKEVGLDASAGPMEITKVEPVEHTTVRRMHGEPEDYKTNFGFVVTLTNKGPSDSIPEVRVECRRNSFDDRTEYNDAEYWHFHQAMGKLFDVAKPETAEEFYKGQGTDAGVDSAQ